VQVQVRQEEGRRVAVKRATTADEVAALHTEARMLTLARHPGVVELVELRTLDAPVDGVHAELVTRHVSHQSLATFAARDLRQAATIVAACAETVADLHSVSIVHRRLEPAHVLIDERGRPVLTGFGGATLVGSAVDDDAAPARPAVDVAGLGRLVQHIAAGPPEADPIPDRRFTKRTRAVTYQRRALLNLADQATTETAARPSARSLAAAIRAVVPDARFETAPPLPARPRLAAPRVAADRPASDAPRTPVAPPRPARPPRSHSRTRRGLPIAAAACGVAALGFGVASAGRDGRATPADEVTTTATTTATTTTTTTATATATATTTTTAPSSTVACRPGSCTTSSALGDAPLAEDGHRYAAGDPGDEVVVGDWTCAGSGVPALIRPSTGEVFVFDRWAGAGHDEVARPVFRATPGSHLEAHVGDGCATLVVRAPDSSATTVTVDGPSS
jgi:hypothetical protein